MSLVVKLEEDNPSSFEHYKDQLKALSRHGIFRIRVGTSDHVNKDGWVEYGINLLISEQPTFNCQLTTFGGINALLDRYGIDNTVKVMPQIVEEFVRTSSILFDVSDKYKADLLTVIKKLGYEIILDSPYKNPTGFDMSLVYVTVREYKDDDYDEEYDDDDYDDDYYEDDDW